MSLAMFRCVPFATKLSTKACVERHRVARLGGREANGAPKIVGYQRCAECPVGAAHAGGETASTWADGSPVELVAEPVIAPGSSRWLGPPVTAPDDGYQPSPVRAPRSAPIPAVYPPAAVDRSAPRAAEPIAAERIAAERPIPSPSEGARPESAAAGGAGRALVQAGPAPAREVRMSMGVCKHCSKEFEKPAPAARYCSDECREKGRAARPSNAKPARTPESTTTAKASKKAAKPAKTSSQSSAPRTTAKLGADVGRAALDMLCSDIDAQAAELDRLMVAANQLATALGLPERYEVG